MLLCGNMTLEGGRSSNSKYLESWLAVMSTLSDAFRYRVVGSLQQLQQIKRLVQRNLVVESHVCVFQLEFTIQSGGTSTYGHS